VLTNWALQQQHIEAKRNMVKTSASNFIKLCILQTEMTKLYEKITNLSTNCHNWNCSHKKSFANAENDKIETFKKSNG